MEKVNWFPQTYRVNHSTVKLNPLMLENKFEKRIDGKIVSFDASYINWRINRLLNQFSDEEKVLILENTANEIRENKTKNN